MAVFTFIVKHSSGTWTAKQHTGDLEESASSTWELQRKLTNLALQSAGSGAVSSSFSLITPSSAVAQVIVGGGGGGGGATFSGGAAGTSSGGAAPAAAAEEKKEEKEAEKEESDDDMGFSLFD